MYTIGAPLVVWFLARLGVSEAATDQNVYATITTALIDIVLLLIVLGIPRLLRLWSSKIDYRRLLGLTRLLQWRDIGLAIIGFVVMWAIVFVIALIAAQIPGYDSGQAQDTGFSKSLAPGNAALVLLTLVVVAPVVEEIIFRGYLFGTLRRSTPVWVAALVTSLLFGLAHLQWNVGIQVFALSLVSCYLRYRTGSLWASILLHMMKNGLAFYVLYVATSSIG